MATTAEVQDNPGATGRTWSRIIACLVSVTVVGLIVPGGGLVLAAIFWFTALRSHRPIGVIALLVGVILAAGAVFGLGPVIFQSSTTSVTDVVSTGG